MQYSVLRCTKILLRNSSEWPGPVCCVPATGADEIERRLARWAAGLIRTISKVKQPKSTSKDRVSWRKPPLPPRKQKRPNRAHSKCRNSGCRSSRCRRSRVPAAFREWPSAASPRRKDGYEKIKAAAEEATERSRGAPTRPPARARPTRPQVDRGRAYQHQRGFRFPRRALGVEVAVGSGRAHQRAYAQAVRA